MTLFLVVLRALAPLFLLIILGNVLKRARVLQLAHVPILNGLVLNATLPALVFLSLLRAPALTASYARLPLAFWLTHAATMTLALSLGVLLRLPRPTRGALLLVGAFPNTAFLGYPITLSLLPAQFPAAVLLDQFGVVLPLYFVATVVSSFFGSGAGDWRSGMHRFVRSPLFVSALLGLTVHLVPWPPALTQLPPLLAIGTLITQCLTYLSAATTPLILLAMGVALQPRAALKAPSAALLPCLLKLFACPLAMWGACHLLGIQGDLLRVCLLQAAMPTSVLASVLCAESEMDGLLAVGVVFLTTALSLLSLPLILSLLH